MPRKLLIVDDMAINRRILGGMLHGDYDILEAASGAEALELLGLHNGSVSAVLLDISMPDMDGYEVLQRIRANTHLAGLPVIMITGSDDEETRVRSLTLGANDFVMKPYSSAVIKHCLKNNIALQEAAHRVNAMRSDTLTGLLSREWFFETVAKLVAEHEPGHYIMACFDIDKFKVINDQYGAEKGDEVLLHVAKTFREGFEPCGGICCRVFADKFAVIYPAAFGDSQEIIAIRERASRIEGLASPVIFSIGRYVIDDVALTPASMYDRAVLASDTVKGQYGSKVAFYNETMRERLLREQDIVTEMDDALSERQFEVWFQPQYNHSTDAMIGAEALVRWRHPEKGLVPPGEFIPVFEQNGFIYALDMFVWEEVCRYLRKWLDEGRSPLPVSVNISRYDVFAADIVDVITGLIEKYRLPIELLRLEITESAFSQSEEHIVDVVREFVGRGFTVEIDDFGSGYSSLNTLKDVPAQIIKLDMKFLESGKDSERGGNIIESVVRMAKWLGMSVIAEGVETLEQANYLRSIGCSYMQGYLYARPMPADKYEQHCNGSEKEERLLTLDTVENLDNNTFWDPHSMDTLIFNSYVGGACIYEYSGGKIELIRATEKYAQVIGSTGMSVEEALKLNWSDHLDEENLRRIITDLDISVATRSEITGEYVFLDLPGCPHETYLRSTMRVIASAGERFLVYCTNENITAQRQSEKKEKQTSEQMKAIMDSVDVGILAAVLEGQTARYIFANDHYYRMLGYTREQFAQEIQSPYDTVAPEDRAQVFADTEKINEDGVSRVLVYTALTRDGRRRWFRAAISMGRFTGEESDVQLSIVRDITEEREAEQRERRSAEQLQAIMSDMISGVTAVVLSGDRVEFLFSNERFYELHGYTRELYAMEVADNFALIHPDDKQRAYTDSMAAYASEEPTTIEYRIIRRDGAVRWLRVGLTSTRLTGVAENVHLCIFTDITESKQAEQALINTDEQLRFLNDMSHELLAQPDTDAGINAVLGKLIEYFNGARAYIFELDRAREVAVNTYEVCREGVSAEKDNLQNVPLAAMGGWFKAFDAKGYCAIESVASLDESRALEREILLAQGISSLFAVPLRRDGKRIGLIGVDDPHFRIDKVDRLVAIGDYIAVMLTRRDLNERISSDNRALNSMMGDMPGGFVRMQAMPDGSVCPLYFNKGFQELTAMSNDELMDIYGHDAYAGVHESDVAVVHEAVERMFAEGEAQSARYRIRHGKGGYIWLMFFGRVTKGADGETFLNIYYTDASRQAREEETQRALLDNLPGGAGVYEYRGGKLSIVYLNDSYWKLVGRRPKDYAGRLPMTASHSDDMKVVFMEIESAVEQNRDMTCDIRIMHETKGFFPVRLIGHIVPADNGAYRIYTTFTPISPEKLSYQQMLPLLLSAMMESTSDLSFAKDMGLRYISVSSAFAHMTGRESVADVIGRTDYELFEKGLADKYRKDDEALLQSGQSIIDALESLPPKDGAPRYSSTSKYLLRDSSDNIVGLYGVGRDVTRTVTQDSQLRLVNDSMPGGLATYYCTQGEFNPKNVRLIYYNDGFCNLFGYTREEYAELHASDPANQVFEQDKPELIDQWYAMMETGAPTDCIYRAHIKGGGYKWVNHRAVVADKHGDNIVINAILQDVTDQKELIEQLRISEEENNLAVRLGGSIICRYMIDERTLSISSDASSAGSMPRVVQDVPYEQVRSGAISPESADAYIGFFEAIIHGSRAASAVFQQRSPGGWRWMEAKSSTIFSGEGKPVKAVISIYDVTDRLERETIYRKWQQSLEDRAKESYTLVRCNLNNDSVPAQSDGTLLYYDFDNADHDFNARAREYINQYVHNDDKDSYRAFVNSDTLLAGYYRGKRSGSLEYREALPTGGTRWLRLTVDLVEYPNSTEVEAYLLYEDIDEAKRTELQTKELSETDPLTGVLNRAMFATLVNRALHSSRHETRHALLMLDIDGFKQVNDVFGHGAGDQTLVDIADSLRSILRRDDLVARLGGDEFLVFLNDIADDSAAAGKARQICTLTRKAFSMEVQISGSVGIAVAPRDGVDFETLYRKADAALYFVKGSGKNSHVFYNEDMVREHLVPEQDAQAHEDARKPEKKRRMLIVDDNVIDNELLQNIFKDEFIIEKAKDGASALIRMRHYGSAISVVLLDLMMPGMDGFAVLEKMQASPELSAIPVIIVSGDESRESCLKAIRKGATDFITKPVDPEILRIRVRSAVSRAENERLRAKNCLLEVQNEERVRYESALESTGMTFIEYNWHTGAFEYYPSTSKYLLGTYDKRPFWYILLSDMVADTQTVQDMQNVVHRVAGERDKTRASRIVRLRTPKNGIHNFRMNVHKITDEYKLTNKIIIALCDLEYKEEQEGE